MDKFILLLGYVGMPLVCVLQPLRLVLGVSLFFRPPVADRCLNRAVLAIATFIRLLSLVLAGYFIWQQMTRGHGLFSSMMATYMVFPFVIFVMGEMIAGKIHCCDE